MNADTEPQPMNYATLDTYQASLHNEEPPRSEDVTEIQCREAGDLLCYANPVHASRIVAGMNLMAGIRTEDLAAGRVKILTATFFKDLEAQDREQKERVARLRAHVVELTQWMRSHCGPSDTCHAALCRAIETLHALGVNPDAPRPSPSDRHPCPSVSIRG